MTKRFFSDFKDTEKLNCWSRENTLKPYEVKYYSRKKIKFDCNKCGHGFESILSNVTKKNGTWCPFCANKKLCGKESCTSCFGKSFASCDDKDKLKCWSDKNTINPIEVFKNSNRNIIFKCNKCPHEFESKLSHVTSGHWCPFCENNKLCGQESCTSCFGKSFASCDDKDKLKCWSDKNTINPIEVFKNSNRNIIFKCNKCPHEFESKLFHVTNGHWCPFCANKRLCGKESCTSCFGKSFASYDDKDKLKCWSDKNTLNPIEVFKGSKKKIIFKCNKCPHEFESALSNVTKKNGTWCPFCANHKLCGQESCTSCFGKSFASYGDKDKLKCWSDKNTLNPIEVFKGSDKKIIFNCNKCPHEFESVLNDETWCKFCHASKNRFIKKLFDIFDGMRIEYNVEVPVKCGSRLLKWDMVVYNNNREFYIESDGEQHFSVEGFIRSCRTKISKEESQNKFKDQRKRDLLKEKNIVDNNNLLFRISYRQLKQLENLVGIMISKSNENNKGVVKMDDIYNW